MDHFVSDDLVGGGSAGCVLANRLSADNEVLLVEAGPYDSPNRYTMHTPGLLAFNIASPCYNWYFYTEPQKNLNNRRLFYPRFETQSTLGV